MTKEERIKYVVYRIESAYKTLDAAKVLAQNEFWNSAMNRLYYAVFYAVNALLVLNEIQAKSHAGTKSAFSQYFVKTGKFEKAHGKLLSELFNNRQKGDYGNIYEYDSETVNAFFEPVEEMIRSIEEVIKSTDH